MGKTQSDFAAIAAAADVPGATRQSQAKYEKGIATPSATYLAAIAAAGADVRYILTGSRDGPEPEVLTSEERVMLDYFRQASGPVRKAALGALLSASPSTGGTGIKIGQVFGQNIEGNQTNKGPLYFGVSPPKPRKSSK